MVDGEAEMLLAVRLDVVKHEYSCVTLTTLGYGIPIVDQFPNEENTSGH